MDNADLHEDGKVPWWFKNKDATAVTDHNNIYFRYGEYDPTTVEGLAELGHELVHVGQYRRGELTKLKYLMEAARHGSDRKNKYEKPAYDLEDEILDTLPDLLNDLLERGLRCGCEKPPKGKGTPTPLGPLPLTE